MFFESNKIKQPNVAKLRYNRSTHQNSIQMQNVAFEFRKLFSIDEYSIPLYILLVK